MHPKSAATANSPIDYRMVALLSLLLSLWLIAIDPLVNRDAIIYLRSADAYLQHGFMASLGLFDRPLLAICIATITQLSGIGLLHAGLLLNTLFYALFSVGFVATVQTLGGDRRIQWLAAVVVLSHPLLNDHRSSIMRDPAYWALLVLSFRELLLYVRNPGLKHQLGWFLCILTASLFRFEGLFFAALAPLSLLSMRNLPQGAIHCLRFLLPQLAIVATLFILALIVQDSSAPGSNPLPAIGLYLDRLLALPQSLAGIATDTGQAMLDFSAREDALIAVLAGLAAVLLINLCRAITWPYVLLLLWGCKDHVTSRLRPDDLALLRFHLLISLGYLALFTLINRFMLERYASQFGIFIMLCLPFILNTLWHDGERRWKKTLVAVLLLGMSLDSLHNTDYQKVFVRDASEWLVANTPAQATLLSNDRYLGYFSGRSMDWDAAGRLKFDMWKLLERPGLWRNRDYIAMLVRERDSERWDAFLAANSLPEVATFDGGRHGRVSVVKIPERLKR